jgi:hypothetical protein
MAAGSRRECIRPNWRLVAGVAVMLVALIVVGRLQGQNLGAGDADPSRAASTTVADTVVEPSVPVR